jgi:Tol biopolymer transport system component
MSKLGGEAKKVLVDISSPIGFSPDGKRFAFVRAFPDAKKTVLMTANADGTDEQPLATRTEPDKFPPGLRPAWSPDNKTIACIGINSGEKFLRVLTVLVADGTVQNLTSENWSSLQDVAWLQGSDTLLVTAQDDIHFGPVQIWAVSVSGGGAATKITSEIRSYLGLSLAADSSSILAIQSESFTDVWLMPWSETDQAKQSLSIKGGGRVDLSWTPDGRIVYISSEAGPPTIFVMNADGSNKIQLTTDTYPKRSPIVSPDGRNIVFVSNQAGDEQLWRIDIDGQNQRQIGSDWVYREPQFSPDGKWIVYSTWKNDEKKAYLWKIFFDGGDKVSLGAGTTYTPNVSPDMKWVAYLDRDQQPGKSLIKVVPIAGGEASKTFEVSANTPPNNMRWSPDGKAIMYQTSPAGGTNLFQQSLTEDIPKKITDFKYDFPIHCSVSRDMKQVACLRNKAIKDVILFNLQQ